MSVRPVHNAGQAVAETEEEYADAFVRELGAVMFGDDAWACSCGVVYNIKLCGERCPVCQTPRN